MTTGQFADKFTDHIVQVQTRLHVRQQHSILLLQGFPIASVHILHIVAITESTPNLIVDLRPFFAEVHRCHQIVCIHSLIQTHTVCWEVHYIDLSTLIYYSLLGTSTILYAATLKHFLVLLCGEVKYAGSLSTTIIELFAVREETTSIATHTDRQLDDATKDAIWIYLHRSRSLTLSCIGTRTGGWLIICSTNYIVLWQQW